jgi:polysaccharide biosynthesis protein PslG
LRVPRRAWSAAVVIAVVLAGCSSSSGPSSTPKTHARPSTGVAEGGFADGHSLLDHSDRDLARELDGMVAAGATWLRTDVDWWRIQPDGPSDFDWGPVDRVIEAARARGLRVIGMIGYTPPWARPRSTGSSDKYPPTDVSDYANFARAVARRYEPLGVRHWEVWNEPNVSAFWKPKPNPADYTALLKAAYPAIKSADPGATVITAGTSPAIDLPDGSDVMPVTFLEGIYAAGGGGYFDAVAHHPSNYPNLPTKPEADYRDNSFAGIVPKLHETMQAHGDGAKKIWATEMGAPAPYGDITVDFLAAYIRDAYRAWADWSFVGPLIWYSYRDQGTNPTDVEDHFGVVYENYSAKEPALSTITEVLGG